MDSPRHRFQRDEPSREGSSEGVSELDFRLVSIEDELKTVSLSSAMQARDFQALRAKVETLEGKSGGDVGDSLGRVFDHIEAQDDRLEQVFDRLQVMEGRIQEFAHRLDNLGDIGPLENLPMLLEQSLVTSLDDLEARLELKIEALGRETQAAGSGGVSIEQLETLRAEMDEKLQEVKDGLDRILEDRQEELLDMIQASAAANAASGGGATMDPAAIKQVVNDDLDQIRNAIVELQEAYENVPSKDEVERLASQSQGNSVSSDDVTALAGEMAGLKDKIKDVEEKVGALGDGDLQEKLNELLKFSEDAEKHQEKVDEAMRLVSELEEKTKNLGESGAAAPVAAPAAPVDDGLTPPPGETQLKLTLRDLVREMVKNRVSDLHIKTGRAITARIGKELIQFSTPPLTPADSFHLITSALRTSHRKRLVEERDIEFVYQYESIRLRANVFFDRGNLSATFKMLSNRPPELENLGLPKAFSTLLGRPSGLVLVCGLPGSGRSTTLTASLDFLNRTRQLHLVSLEDRLEYTHEDRRSLVTQRELDADIVSFAQGTKRAMGQDSDVVFIADLFDRETMDSVFSAVDSGLLVIGAITAQDAEDAIPRLINLFPENERRMRARLFARSLQGILSLKLFERADGDGLVPASELLLATSTVRRLIEDANLSALHRQVVGGGAEGMQTFSDSIERLIETGLIHADAGKAELERINSAAGAKTVGGAAPSQARPQSPPPAQAPRPAAPPAPRPQESAPPPQAAAPAPPQQAPAPTPPAQPSAPPPQQQSSGEGKPAQSGQRDTEAFGEEDTLMNWL
ncbi:MAG: Flp pilus assembly complex ATPase component TadA [Candidatus Eremiobacteraeota bacterium]|nr:Flp pilus assembly complex ATPase component TadA [Candidatus Eremiobacteraeota bacterium]